MRRFLLSATVLGALVLMLGVVAASAASGYSLFGDAQLVSPGESSPHAVQATSTGTNLYGGVDFAVPAGLTVNDLSNLATDYKFTVGSCGLGSPRFSVEVNDNPNVDAGNEDGVLQDALYREVMGVFLRRIQERRRAS